MLTSNKLWISAALAPLAVALIVGLFLHKPMKKATAAVQNPLVAIVNDTPIHQSDLSILSPPASPQEAIGLLVDFTLLDQEARKKKITISDAELEQSRQVIDPQRGKSYADTAKALGRTPAGLDLQLRHAALLHKLAALEFKSRIGKMFHARGILVRPDGRHAKSDAQARAFAEKLQKQIQDGADITALARQDSDDSESAPQGGDFGIIQLAGAPNLVRFAPDFKLQKALANAVNTAMPRSFLNGPIHGDFGYWVVEVMSTDTRQFSDMSRYQQIRGLWQEMWVRRLEPIVMGKLRGNAEIQPPLAAEPQLPTARNAPPPGSSPGSPTL